MSKDKNKPFLRQKLILEYIIKLVKDKPNQETFNIGIGDLQKFSPLLKDIMSLKIAFEKITKYTNNNITTEFHNIEKDLQTATGGKYSELTISIHIEDKEKLNEDYQKFKNQSVDNTKKEKIKKLSLFTDERGQLLVTINDNYLEKDIISVKGKNWTSLLKVGQKEDMPINKDASYLGLKDYLNSNINCKLYSQTNYSLTKILAIRGGKLIPNINIEIINNRIFKQRQNKMKLKTT